MERWKVQVFHKKTGEVVLDMTTTSERAAQRVEDGAVINLDRANYDTRIVPPETQNVSADS